MYARLAAAVASKGTARSVHGPESTLSRHGLLLRADKRARELQALGVGAGELVALSLGNVAELVVMLLACSKLGAVAVPVDPAQPGARWQPVTVAVEPEALAAALDVLFENVFAHTERTVAFQLSVTPGPGGGCVITVDDAGTGFDPSLAAAGRSGGGSTGLGLAIVDRLARSTGGTMTVEPSPMGGARVVCRLGTGAPRTAAVV